MIEYLDPRLRQNRGRIGVLPAGEAQILRDLARAVREIGASPVQRERALLWKRHNGLERIRPMVLVFPEGAWRELLPWGSMSVTDQFWRSYEYCLRRLLYRSRHIPDDFVIEPVMEIPVVSQVSPYLPGASPLVHTLLEDDGSTSHPVQVLRGESDLAAMRPAELRIDTEQTDRIVEAVGGVLGDILPITTTFNPGIDTSFIRPLVDMRGAEQVLYDLVDRPAWVHEVLSFMCASTMHLLDVIESQGLMTANTGNDYVGSGGLGFTDELACAGSPVTLRSCWGRSDAQELASVSPAMFEEFALAYHAPVLARYGLSCYGCCEPMTDRIPVVRRHVPNLRRVSVSPWTDRARAAGELQDRCVYSWKPNPALVATGFDREVIEADIGETLRVAGSCVLEMILKDTHTVQGDGSRLTRWAESASRAAAEGYPDLPPR